MSEKAVYAAGAVLWREVEGKIHVLLVHRTQYGDVTIPKGKVDPGESLPQTAVREMLEETGLKVSLGVPLGISKYRLNSGREKVVHYWAARVSEKAIRRSTFVPNNEIAGLEWVPIKQARKALSYAQDVEILNNFDALVAQDITKTFALIVLRHGKAEPVGSLPVDADRPLTKRGHEQAAALVQTLRAWAPKRIVTSNAVRCVETVTPLAEALALTPELTHGLSQESHQRGEAQVRKIVGKRIRARKSSVLCSHGPVLPDILKEIALATGTPLGRFLDDAAALETGGFSIVHLSKTHPASGIITIETYPPQA